jgi:hypothetical protein
MTHQVQKKALLVVFALCRDTAGSAYVQSAGERLKLVKLRNWQQKSKTIQRVQFSQMLLNAPARLAVLCISQYHTTNSVVSAQLRQDA